MENKQKSLGFLFEQAKRQNPKSSFEYTKELFSANAGGIKNGSALKTTGSVFKLKTLLIMIGLVLGIPMAIFVYQDDNTGSQIEQPLAAEEVEPVIESEIIVQEDNVEEEVDEVMVTAVEVKDDSFFDRAVTCEEDDKGELQQKIAFDYRDDKVEKFEYVIESTEQDEPYRFPVLTEEQIAENNKRKFKMLKRLAKVDRKDYVFVPGGTFKAGDKNVSVKAFFMKNTEVTVVEYRTFLFDLLIAGRKSDFLIAKPNQELWKDLGESNEVMTQMYFSHPAYDHYPVNNISREGAELYCKWMSEEVMKLEKKIKFQAGDMRIPTDFEWMWAAYGGNNEAYDFPWKTNSCINEDDRYLANYKPVVKDSAGKYVNNYFIDGGFFTVKADSYNPNDFGLYNMSGNVAEMVVCHQENNLPATKGGSWMDDEKELHITSVGNKGVTDEHLGIGFRPVFTFIGTSKGK